MIVLPWPPVELSPNDRAHRMVKASKGRKYREWMRAQAIALGVADVAAEVVEPTQVRKAST